MGAGCDCLRRWRVNTAGDGYFLEFTDGFYADFSNCRRFAFAGCTGELLGFEIGFIRFRTPRPTTGSRSDGTRTRCRRLSGLAAQVLYPVPVFSRSRLIKATLLIGLGLNYLPGPQLLLLDELLLALQILQ